MNIRLFFILIIFSISLFANIATVVDSVGKSHLIRDGKSIKVVQKQQLKEHDTIKTGKNAKVKIFFKDNTAVSLGQNTIFHIDTYLFTGKKDSQIKFRVLKGFFKTVTGKIGKVAPNRFKLQTKNATIGIRGTVFAANVDDSIDYIICTDGKIIILTLNGKIEIDQGKISSVKKGTKPKARKYSKNEREELIKQAGWHGSMSLKELIAYIKKTFNEPLKSQLLATLQNILNKDSKERELYLGKEKAKNADDKSFVDSITINDREFDELPNEVEFYPEDLKDGRVIVQGILESEDKNTPIESLHVETTTDGGESWSRAKGSKEWEWSFEPELERPYEFSLRVVQEMKISNAPIKIVGAEVLKEQFVKVEKKEFTPKVITTNSIVLKFKHFTPKVITTEPIVLKFKHFTPKIITTEPIVLKFKNKTLIQKSTMATTGILKSQKIDKLHVKKPLLLRTTVKQDKLYAVTMPKLKFKLVQDTRYEVQMPTLKFKVKQDTLYEATMPKLEFKLVQDTKYEVQMPTLKFKVKQDTLYEAIMPKLEFRLKKKINIQENKKRRQ
jgi:hypothetical protein